MSGCGAGARCHRYDQAAQLPAPAALPAQLCADCLRLAERDIAALPADYVDLEQLLPGGGRGLTQRVGGRPAPGTPLDLGVDALQREVAYGLTAWEAPVREAAGLSRERVYGVRPGWAVSAAARVLAPRVALMSTLRPLEGYWRGVEAAPNMMSGLDGIAALRRLHGRCRGLLGMTRLVQQMPGECSGCGMAALRRQDGRDAVACANCGRRWSMNDYRRYVSLVLRTPVT